jgi:hypothetical protein
VPRRSDLECRKRAIALILRTAAVNGRGSHTGALELRREPVGAAPRAAEHDRGAGRRNELGDDRRALGSVDAPEHVVRAPAVGLGAARLVVGRVVLVITRQHLDRTVERCREQQRLARLGSLVEQAPDLGKESHVGHAVGLVDDDHLDVVELERTLTEQVGEPAGHATSTSTPRFKLRRWPS